MHYKLQCPPEHLYRTSCKELPRTAHPVFLSPALTILYPALRHVCRKCAPAHAQGFVCLLRRVFTRIRHLRLYRCHHNPFLLFFKRSWKHSTENDQFSSFTFMELRRYTFQLLFLCYFCIDQFFKKTFMKNLNQEFKARLEALSCPVHGQHPVVNTYRGVIVYAPFCCRQFQEYVFSLAPAIYQELCLKGLCLP